MRTRVALGALGLAAAAYGAWMLLDDPPADLLSVALWLAGGVLLHDLVLAPVTVLAGRVVVRWPRAVQAPVVTGGVILAAVTLLAVPVLGRFGASPGNPTLLDRDYTLGWLTVAGLVTLGVVLATARDALRGGARHGVGPGR